MARCRMATTNAQRAECLARPDGRKPRDARLRQPGRTGLYLPEEAPLLLRYLERRCLRAPRPLSFSGRVTLGVAEHDACWWWSVEAWPALRTEWSQERPAEISAGLVLGAKAENLLVREGRFAGGDESVRVEGSRALLLTFLDQCLGDETQGLLSLRVQAQRGA